MGQVTAERFVELLQTRPFVAGAAAFAASALATPAVIAFARARGLLAKPRADRWHKTPTALFGGVAIWFAVVAVGLWRLPWTAQNAGVLLGTTLMFAVGLVDDILHIKPSSKLIGQIAAACIAVLAGVHVEALPQPFLFVPVTIIWIVGITNAFNLIDNMDGLSAGVAAISALFIVAFSAALGNHEVAVLAAIVGGAAAGFLLYNFNPARVFMGDCGSMVLGFALACAALEGTWHQASNLFLLLAAPALLLAVPIFDTALVTVLRTLAGRPVSQGGRDHSSHRLVALGLTERRAVLLLYGVCVTFGLLALGGLVYGLFLTAVGALLLVVGIFFFGVFLGQVPVYGPAPASLDPQRPPPALVNALLLHKRRIAEVVVDFALICAAYSSAYLLRYEGAVPEADAQLIVRTLPVVIVMKLSAFFLFGVYRGVWKYVGIRDAMNLAKAVVAGSAASVLTLLAAYRFEGLSRSVFVLDGLLLLFFAAGARVMLRVLRESFPQPNAATGRRVLVIGAGDGGEMLLRELRNNPSLGMVPVGLVDDNREKHGRQLHGVEVLGGSDSLEEIAARVNAEEIVIAIPSASGPRLAELATRCAATGLPFRTTRRITELVDGRVTAEAIRELDVLDVVARRKVRIEDARVRDAVAGRSIAIVGAGGTVGSAVAARAALFGPARLLLIDRDDNSLSRLKESFRSAAFPVDARLADAHEVAQLARLFTQAKVDAVIHAASVSQFLLLEENPIAAARVNVLAARASALAAEKAGARVFVLASSIKAGSGTNVLGATRRLAEAATLSLASSTFSVRAVRLGNVLGSRGGLLARFREQALAGAPVTVTHEEAARFVLVAEEAASALLAAAAPALEVAPGHLLVPDHGEQVKVADIATAVVHWAKGAQRASSNVDVTIVGLRPGEALRDPSPDALVAVVPGLFSHPVAPIDGVAALVDALDAAVRAADEDRVRSLLRETFPELGAAPANVIPLRR